MDIEGRKKQWKKSEEFTPLFYNSQIPGEVEITSKELAARIPKPKKLCGWLTGERLLVYVPLLEWYLDHGLEITAVYRTIDYQPRKIFTWFVDEVTEEQTQRGLKPRQGPPCGGVQDAEEQRLQQADENKDRQTQVVYTKDWELLNEALRSVWFDDLEDIKDVFEIEFRNVQVKVNRPFQLGIVVYQLARLRMLQFYYDCLARYLGRRDFKLIQWTWTVCTWRGRAAFRRGGEA